MLNCVGTLFVANVNRRSNGFFNNLLNQACPEQQDGDK